MWNATNDNDVGRVITCMNPVTFATEPSISPRWAAVGIPSLRIGLLDTALWTARSASANVQLFRDESYGEISQLGHVVERNEDRITSKLVTGQGDGDNEVIPSETPLPETSLLAFSSDRNYNYLAHLELRRAPIYWPHNTLADAAEHLTARDASEIRKNPSRALLHLLSGFKGWLEWKQSRCLVKFTISRFLFCVLHVWTLGNLNTNPRRRKRLKVRSKRRRPWSKVTTLTKKICVSHLSPVFLKPHFLNFKPLPAQ